ncbi:uncharacterized protein DUF4345 [Nocardioides albertanoniae]|uniref:Uncharacterized protein DUF4345 n=1 Tax=Nocardioides albertanoniae TaxID=1175486 RepID=A0A543AC88_9ACTN|nr:uncharacterized protein DUF4345 [Nocardioides albertanoniae]
MNWPAAVFLLGGVGRVVSVVAYGWPHWFQIPLTVLELVIPPILFALTAAARRTEATTTAP